MADFKFEQNVVPVQHIDTDTSGGNGGDGGHSGALAYGYNTSEAGDGGLALGGDGGDADGGDGNGLGLGGPGGDSIAHSHAGDANQAGLLNLNLFGGPTGGDSAAVSQGGNGGGGFGQGFGGAGGTAGDGGNADASGGHATTYGVTAANSSADGGNAGDGGDATVNATQNTGVSNDFDFARSFNEDNDTTLVNHSFNSDNDGVDTKGGYIGGHSIVAGDDIDDSFNTTHNVDFTEIKDSGNSFQDNDALDIDVHHVLDIL
ncbi:MAG: hypothetical protein QOG46_913 [Pseudonocardiales bacterium]|jgi:hypothetical protein|nr:hypothetical protein [Pseudonocardiales bacterium]